MPCSNLSTSRNAARLPARALAGLAAACVVHGVGLAATLPTAPQTFDTTYAAPTGATLTVAAGGDLQAALNQAQLGDTIVLQAGATFTGPFKLPNKTTGTGWIYVVSSNLASLPPPAHASARITPSTCPRLCPEGLQQCAGHRCQQPPLPLRRHRVRAGCGRNLVYQLIAIGNADTSPATLAHHIVFDRCYVHGDPAIRTIGVASRWMAHMWRWWIPTSATFRKRAPIPGPVGIQHDRPTSDPRQLHRGRRRERAVRRRGFPRGRARARGHRDQQQLLLQAVVPDPDPIHHEEPARVQGGAARRRNRQHLRE